ncbi:hypothetical protein BV20DRAFT_978112 [Pilatotrama ljubarskyi]|nr:hypothetical protein BV20DRAFT_978112 [Pilatotrama ljubarskyi]
MRFFTIVAFVAAFVASVVAGPAGREATESAISTSVVSEAEMAHFLATTDAELTFIGEPINPLAKRSAQSTTVMYCTKRVGTICGGTCTVYNGGAACLDAAGTTCISATHDVGFCDETECNGSCNILSLCGTPMGNGFCFTPNTASILVSPL